MRLYQRILIYNHGFRVELLADVAARFVARQALRSVRSFLIVRFIQDDSNLSVRMITTLI